MPQSKATTTKKSKTLERQKSNAAYPLFIKNKQKNTYSSQNKVRLCLREVHLWEKGQHMQFIHISWIKSH